MRGSLTTKRGSMWFSQRDTTMVPPRRRTACDVQGLKTKACDQQTRLVAPNFVIGRTVRFAELLVTRNLTPRCDSARALQPSRVCGALPLCPETHGVQSIRYETLAMRARRARCGVQWWPFRAFRDVPESAWRMDRSHERYFDSEWCVRPYQSVPCDVRGSNPKR